MDHVIVIGAGQAGASCVAKLRNGGFEGDVTLIGAEPVAPYQRPPLSKAYLMGDMALERLFLRPETFYAENRITLRTDARVAAIDTASQTVTLADGESLTYSALVLATGSEPRRLPAAVGGTLDHVFTVRDLSDANMMAPHFRKGARLLVIGGGYIGLEAAAVAAKLGLQVTLVEMAERILQRVAAPQTSDYFRALHRAHGVDIREGVGLVRLLGETAVTGAALSDDTMLGIDFAIVGVGILPVTGLAEAAGIDTDNGIATDAQGRASAPNVWAAGDCASFPYQAGRIRLESVPNAIDQAEVVAENIMGAGKSYLAKPWFWSDQYDVKLQIAGLNTGYTDVVSRIGAGRTASYWYYLDGNLLAVDAMNDPRAYMIGKRLIEAGKTADPAVVADADADLKPLLQA
ncbi:MAG: FAD-dependent oxidoreductase [Roseobacter sp.]|jgi:3-phenylpropionate/trans-cinnamate dioxygenase ferredoxin reductase subunit|nr:FAD-dependent oxidoreductase [Roseobacter sp.]